MTGVELAWLRHRVKKSGFEPLQFAYPTVRRDLAANAEALFHFARAVQTEELHFVGYSLGGLVVLEMLERFGRELPAGRVVLIGSPVRGSSAANHLVGKPWGRVLLGEAGPNGLAENHVPRWNITREVGVIAGTRSIGLGKIIGLDSEPNDGTVAVAETRLENETDRLELPLTHATLMFSRRVADAIVKFLREGRFA